MIISSYPYIAQIPLYDYIEFGFMFVTSLFHRRESTALGFLIMLRIADGCKLALVVSLGPLSYRISMIIEIPGRLSRR